MCRHHDIELLKRKADALRDSFFFSELAVLEKKWEEKRWYEEKFRSDYVSGNCSILTSFQDEPVTAISVRFKDNLGNSVVGHGWSMCDGRDVYNPVFGLDTAIKKAIRNAARKAVGLDAYQRTVRLDG